LKQVDIKISAICQLSGITLPCRTVLPIFASYGRLTFGTMNVGTIARDAVVAQEYYWELKGGWRGEVVSGD
jgi:hypothetical protein